MSSTLGAVSLGAKFIVWNEGGLPFEPRMVYVNELRTLANGNGSAFSYWLRYGKRKHGAQLIAVLSFDWPTIADKHYTHLVFQAVENRLSAIKADIGFDSTIIDPYGRIRSLSTISQLKRAIRVANVLLS